MAASDHLNAEQFGDLSTHQIGSLWSSDYPGHQVHEVPGMLTSDRSTNKLRRMSERWDVHRDDPITVSRSQHGLQELVDGHHRYAVAKSKGQESMRVRYRDI